MFARISEVSGPPENLDVGIAQYNDMVLPQIQGMDGFVRAYLLVDRDSGKAMSISVWETAEAMAASDAAAAGMRQQVATTISGQSSVSSYEIVVEG